MNYENRIGATLIAACLIAGGIVIFSPASRNQVWIEGGTFTMGSTRAYPEERFPHEVTVDGFLMDAHEVTNDQFAKFIKATGYLTVAERVPEPLEGAPPEMLQPGSLVFVPLGTKPDNYSDPTQWWAYVPGASWRHPEGPHSNIEGKGDYPVVQVAYEDVQAYCEWAGRRLPTEAEFEYAAQTSNKYEANTWQGVFPYENTADDLYEGIAPACSYNPNELGIHDLIGNVWEWTSNWYRPTHNIKDTVNPQGPPENLNYDPSQGQFPTKVAKGGSYLCSDNFCRRYRASARHAQDIGIGTNHLGFRTVAK